MISGISFIDSCKNVLKVPVLLSILIISCLVVAILAGYSTFYTMPIFSHLLVKNIEEEAKRTADYLSAVLLTDQIHPNFDKQVKADNTSVLVPIP